MIRRPKPAAIYLEDYRMQSPSISNLYTIITDLPHLMGPQSFYRATDGARTLWNFKQVVSPFSRLWLALDGHATAKPLAYRAAHGA